MTPTPTPFPVSLARTPALTQTGTITWPWLKWLQTLGVALLPVSPVPAAHDSPGTVNQAAVDANFLYICVAKDTWKRTALTTW